MILGGPAKAHKTFLAVQLSLAVAAATDVFPGFAAPTAAPVLFFGAEDSLSALRLRFDGLATVRGLALATLPIFLIDTPRLCLDQPADLARLRAAIESVQPLLLVLDPFVRIAGATDENSAAEVARVLGSLRALQRDYGLAVLLVHHARKAAGSRPYHALRGSTDFAAWSDANLFLHRAADHISLLVEHRSAAAPDPLTLRLATDPAPHLVLVDDSAAPSSSLHGTLSDDLLRHLDATPRPLSGAELGRLLRKRKADVLSALTALHAAGHIVRVASGWTSARRHVSAD